MGKPDTPRQNFLQALAREASQRPAVGSATSVITTDLMQEVGISFPDAHVDAEKMAGLASAGHDVLGHDNVMPLFSVWHESEALGCPVNWGDEGHMPDCRTAPYTLSDRVEIPDDLLTRSGCAVPLEAIGILKRRFGDEVAVMGKVFGPWTLGYHLFGIQEFLINTILDPDAVKRAMAGLKEVAVIFGRAQIEAGADVLCLADHATRDLCSPETYRDFLLETHQYLNSELDVPIVLHICGDTSDRLGYIGETGFACFHFDSRVPAATAMELADGRIGLMGGTSNLDVIRTGDEAAIRPPAGSLHPRMYAGIAGGWVSH